MAQMISSSRSCAQCIRATAWLAGAAVLLLWASRGEALQVTQTNASQQQRVAEDLNMIRAGQQAGMEPLKLGRLWSHLAAEYADAADFLKSEDAYNHALKLFETVPEGSTDFGIVLDNLGSLYLAEGNLNAAESCRKRAMTLRQAAGDKLQIARGESHLAEVSLAKHNFKEATQKASEAYREMLAVEDHDASDLVSTLMTLTYASAMNRQGLEGVIYGREAMALTRSSFAANSMPMGQAKMALGFAEWKAGKMDAAMEDMREGVEILRTSMALGHPYVLGAMVQYRKYLNETHHKREAQQIALEEKKLASLSSVTCPNCTVSVYGLR